MVYEVKYENGLLTITDSRKSHKTLFRKFLSFLETKISGLEVVHNQFIGNKKRYYYEFSSGTYKGTLSGKPYKRSSVCIRKSLTAPKGSRGKQLEKILEEYTSLEK